MDLHLYQVEIIIVKFVGRRRAPELISRKNVTEMDEFSSEKSGLQEAGCKFFF